MATPGVHDGWLVALSLFVSILASYTALDLAGRMRASPGWSRRTWLAAAAIAMGGGIWSMHFVAMLAFHMPGVDINYDLSLTLLSFALPVAVTAIGFHVGGRADAGRLAISGSGLLMGAGIAAMHYTGMAAMRMPADLSYAPGWVAVSLLIAVGAATVAVWLASRNVTFTQRLSAAATMGVAVAGMHYAAMQGATFAAHGAVDQAARSPSLSQTYLAAWVAGTTCFILLLALVAAMFDRHLAHRARKEAVALRASEERFRLLLGSLSDTAIYMLDVEGRVINWNEGAQRLKGYEEHEILGTAFSRFYTEEDRARDLPASALRAAARWGKFETEGWRVRKDQSRFWASVVVHPVRSAGGDVIGYAKVTRDMTQRKQAQEELEQARVALFQSQKMEAIGQLTGGVAHDFNNLLMVILGGLELLRKRLPDDRGALRLLDNATAAAQRGSALTQRMLAFARRQELQLEAVTLPDLVLGMSELLQSSLGSAVQMTTDFPAHLPAVLGDAHQLELAILNLVVNARDAMPEGGALTIGAHATADEVCLSVRDTGMGMDEATLARAQEPFFTTKGVGKGTGLGLSMVQGLAAQSNGRLVLKSRPGEGTTAEIWLPVASADVGRKKPEDRIVARPDVRSLAVLVVDDDLLVLENAAALLEDLGHVVTKATSGQEALNVLSTTSGIDLVIADFAMPNMTGAQLLQQIRRARPEIRAILASGYAELSVQQPIEAVRLLKPFDQNALARAIDDALVESRRSCAGLP